MAPDATLPRERLPVEQDEYDDPLDDVLMLALLEEYERQEQEHQLEE